MIGPNASTDIGDVVAIEVPSRGPYGIEVGPDSRGKGAIVVNWERLPSGKFGQIQKHGGVRIGDVLVAINDTNCADLPHVSVVELLNDDRMFRKTLRFVSMAEFRRQRGRAASESASRFGAGGSRAAGLSFRSAIRRGRVNRQTPRPFVEYEVVCAMLTASESVGKEQQHRWSVWRRYSEFEHLDVSLRKFLGWQMEKIAFPPKYTFTTGKLEMPFIEQRRTELDQYWQALMRLERITDFNRHHCSPELRLFLEVMGQGGLDEPPSRNERENSTASTDTGGDSSLDAANTVSGSDDQNRCDPDEASEMRRKQAACVANSDSRRLAARRRSMQAKGSRGVRRSLVQQRRSLRLSKGVVDDASRVSSEANPESSPSSSADSGQSNGAAKFLMGEQDASQPTGGASEPLATIQLPRAAEAAPSELTKDAVARVQGDHGSTSKSAAPKAPSSNGHAGKGSAGGPANRPVLNHGLLASINALRKG